VAAGVAAAAVAVTVTVSADFLAYPGWLAAQKADLILGPIAVGLYWRRRRPQSGLGPLLIALGFLHAPYIAQSSSNDGLFTFGVHWEGVIYLGTLAVILAFPTGRLDRRVDRLILAVAALGAVVPSSAITFLSPQIFAGGSISACRDSCPGNALVIADDPSLAARLFDVDRAAIIAVALAAAAVLLWRLATGTPPQRRALAIGIPIALVFLLTQALFQITLWLGHADLGLNTYVRWAFVVARSAIWYGFLCALVAAQLFAARVVREVVSESLRRPSLRELAALLRGRLGDPRLQLAFWEPRARAWIDGDGRVVDPPAAASGRALTELGGRGSGSPATAIEHDAQLADDPELLNAAGAAALLALENAEVRAAWESSVAALRESRARIAAAGARERLRLERDLHDGAQQRLFAIQTKVDALRADASDEALARELEEIDEDLVATVEELRSLAHGLYPAALRERGVADALRSVAHTASIPIEVADRGIGRLAEPVEEAVYFSAREAIQNATRHAGRGAKVVVTLERANGSLVFTVADDGVGFGDGERRDGMGITSMRDRVGAVGGRLEITSRPGRGTVVRGSIPLARAPIDL
jgi:signal transduction histidine kinase